MIEPVVFGFLVFIAAATLSYVGILLIKIYQRGLKEEKKE